MNYCKECGTHLTKHSDTSAICPNCGVVYPITQPQQPYPQARPKPKQFQHIGRLVSGIILFLLTYGNAAHTVFLSSDAPTVFKVLDIVWRLLYLVKAILAVCTVVFICQLNGANRPPEESQKLYNKARKCNNIGWVCCALSILFCLIVSITSFIAKWETAKPEFADKIGSSVFENLLQIPSLEEDDIHTYFDKFENSASMTIYYDNIDGVEKLSAINENASTQLMTSWINLDDKCLLKGQYNGTWYYGWGTKDKILVAYGSNKDLIYETMKGYEEQFE